jgi:N4-gp56 family major capsid protein
VYPIICVAREAYGVVRLQGREAVEMKVRQPGASPDSSDPAAQTGSVAGKTYYAAAILCEEWLARIEAPCKATPQ